MSSLVSRAICLTIVVSTISVAPVLADEPPRVGPQTEKRFPPLKVPPGFKATLFACDPLIEYPSAISAGPRPGAIFVAIDYMTGLGYEITRRDEIRLIEDTDGDGYADKETVFAKGFNSIQGLAYHDGTVYVMHAPFLTALRDTKGTGVADERRDLLVGLGLTPEQNPTRLHCANGVVVGHDGWLYLAMGDNGVDVKRPEGDRLVLHGGGILRCRPDGRDLHIYATGLRNIYDVALDAELNVFVRDNENDGGTYMIRACHSFHGADHGYPYLYEERPDEALPPLADLGLGSSAGGVCYLETQFPREYRGNLFFCEWGRSLVRYVPQRAGSGFAPLKEIEFAAGAGDDPYGFKPTDVIVQSDGTMMVSDWGDGQRPKRGRGRIYHIAHVGGKNPPVPAGPDRKLERLDSESYALRCDAQHQFERMGDRGRDELLKAIAGKRLSAIGRMHAIWALARIPSESQIDDLLRIAQSDSDSLVQAQAVRAVADFADPVFVQHKLNAGRGDAKLAEQFVALAPRPDDPRLRAEIVVALGRLHWAGLPEWLRQSLVKPDATLAHAAMQALRRPDNWPAVLKLLDEPADAPIRAIALRAVAERFEPVVVDGLIARLRKEPDAARRREYADALTRVCKRPGPWKYWGYRPAPRPANSVAWERTEDIALALDGVLSELEAGMRLAVLRRMQREKVPVRLATLGQWLESERHPGRVAAILDSLRDGPAAENRPLLEAIVRDRKHAATNRVTALAEFARGLNADTAEPLLALAEQLEDGPVLADALRRTGSLPTLPANPLLAQKLKSSDAEVRAAAIEALAERRTPEAHEPLLHLLRDNDVRVRRAAAGAAGKLSAKPAVEPLLKLATDPDPVTRSNSLDSLRRLREPRAVPLAVAALNDRETQKAALQCLGELGGPLQVGAVLEFARRNGAADVPAAAVDVLTRWQSRIGLPLQRGLLDHAVAEVHGATGVLVRWRVCGPIAPAHAAQVIDSISTTAAAGDSSVWSIEFARGAESRLPLAAKNIAKDGLWLAYTDVFVTEPTPVEFLGSATGGFQVWLNGKSIHRHGEPRNFQVDSDRFGGTLAKGDNRLLVEVGPSPAGVEFHLRFRRKSATAELERLTQAALTRPGDPERGRKLFFDADKSLCLKCHQLGGRGERVGPELTGIGSRFSRIYIVESILEPSRTIAPSFGTLVVSLKNGKELTGVKVAETETTVTLADSQAQKHVLQKADIEEQHSSAASSMPDGLEKRFTVDEFVDLVTFLVNQRENKSP